MHINEVVKQTGLTKKAVAYYTSQGLVCPDVLPNGYRDFSDLDMKRLDQIRVLRKLGLGLDEVGAVLQDPTGRVLQRISVKKELAQWRDTRKSALLQALRSGATFEEISAEMEAVEQQQTITEKLMDAFPGYYGQFLCLHFSRFLGEPIRDAAQRSAFARILTFLDEVPCMDMPQDLAEFWMDGTLHLGPEQISTILERSKQAIDDLDGFLAEEEAALEAYRAFRSSAAFQDSLSGRLMQWLREFSRCSGYYDVFLPAMRCLSPSYSAYCDQMEQANETLLARLPALRSADGVPPGPS